MKKIYLLIIPVIVFIVVSCKVESDTWEKYSGWRNDNITWLMEQELKKNSDGTPYYTKLVPSWDDQAYVLIKYFNDTMLTKDNLKPLYTSTVDVKYIGRLYNDEPFDSSYNNTTPADSIYRTKLTKVIGGWVIAMEHMHIGDSCEVLIPYPQAYGRDSRGIIKPYSALRFNIKLVGIPGYEIPVTQN